MKEEYPQYENMKVIVTNCLNQDNPEHDHNLRSHTGRLPGTMHQDAEETSNLELRRMLQGLDEWRQNLEDEGDGYDVVVVEVCRKRRHRSVAGKNLNHEAREVIFTYYGAKIAPPEKDPMPKHMCDGNYPHCY